MKEIDNPNHGKHATPKVKQVTKYHRRPRRSTRLYDNKKTGVNIAHLSALKSELGTETNLYRKTMPETHALIASMENNSKLYDNTSNNFDPICLAAEKSKSNPDVLTLSSMRKSPDKEQFEKQMTKEIDTMFTKKIFHLVPKNTVPFGKRILPAIWSFRRKRTPDGSVYRHRARLCVHGGRQQEGIDFEET